MVSRKQHHALPRRVTRAAFILTLVGAAGFGQQTQKKFYADDPLLAEPAPRPVHRAEKLKIDELYDYLENSYATPRREARLARAGAHGARDVNTLGEVPDSAWYTRRHYYTHMSIEELKRGPGNTTPPSHNGPWRVISAKSDGVMPGFVIEDQQKNRYVLKFDPPRCPEL